MIIGDKRGSPTVAEEERSSADHDGKCSRKRSVFFVRSRTGRVFCFCFGFFEAVVPLFLAASKKPIFSICK